MYSATVMEHFNHPRNAGALESPDAVGVAGQPGAGNYMILHLKLDGDRITGCGFQTFGCPPAIAAGSLLTEMVQGKTIEEALTVTSEQLEAALGGLPLGRKSCAVLAVDALQASLSDRSP